MWGILGRERALTLDWKTAGVMGGIGSLILGAGMWLGNSTGPAKLNASAILVLKNSIAVNTKAIKALDDAADDDRNIRRKQLDATREVRDSTDRLTSEIRRSNQLKSRDRAPRER